MDVASDAAIPLRIGRGVTLRALLAVGIAVFRVIRVVRIVRRGP